MNVLTDVEDDCNLVSMRHRELINAKRALFKAKQLLWVHQQRIKIECNPDHLTYLLERLYEVNNEIERYKGSKLLDSVVCTNNIAHVLHTVDMEII